MRVSSGSFSNTVTVKDKALPQLILGILEALRHKVDGLVGLVLVWLHCTLFWYKWPVLWLVRQCVLDRKVREISARDICQKHYVNV